MEACHHLKCRELTTLLVGCKSFFTENSQKTQFEGRPLIVTAQLEASQVELTVLHPRYGSAFFDLTRIHFCVPADSITPTEQLATLSKNT
jgi:hypothetical protein